MKNYITPDIIEVEAKDDYTLIIVFDTKEKKVFDMNNLIKNSKVYYRLKYLEYFKKIKPRGDTVEWENGEDVCPEKLYYESVKIEK